jgi:5-oxoprolinase (ATP-hydrolysing) subunit A
MLTVDLNCDMGEGMPNDATLMPFISSANIASGYHAGNEGIMEITIELALQHKVAIGAHPGFDDKENFGRLNVILSSEGYYNLIIEQLILFKKICDQKNAVLHHVKPHGALYNMASAQRTIAKAIAQAVFDFDANLLFYGLSGSYLIDEATALGLKTQSEVFADRTYTPEGYLTPRTNSNALITDENKVVQQVLQMIQEGTVVSTQNNTIPIKAETICLHGDGEHAVNFAQLIHNTLKKNHIGIQSK